MVVAKWCSHRIKKKPRNHIFASTSSENFGHSVTQRLQRIVAVLAIDGASGARHCNNNTRPNIHFTAGTRMGGTNALTVRHRNASTPADPRSSSGHALMQRPHPVHAKTSFFPSIFSVFRVFWTWREVTTPLSNNRGPKRGLKRTVFFPSDPSPAAAATGFNRTTPWTFPSFILTGR